MPKTRLTVPGPAAATSRITSRMDGNASARSTIRISTCSTTPPAYPATRPIPVPTTAASAVAANATSNNGRAPCTSRASSSRPRSSVPKKCPADPIGNSADEV